MILDEIIAVLDNQHMNHPHAELHLAGSVFNDVYLAARGTDAGSLGPEPDVFLYKSPRGSMMVRRIMPANHYEIIDRSYRG